VEVLRETLDAAPQLLHMRSCKCSVDQAAEAGVVGLGEGVRQAKWPLP
jgi:hypothetical protein